MDGYGTIDLASFQACAEHMNIFFQNGGKYNATDADHFKPIVRQNCG